MTPERLKEIRERYDNKDRDYHFTDLGDLLAEVERLQTDLKEQIKLTAAAIARETVLEEVARMLIQWDDFGGDAPEMLSDCVSKARQALK